MTIFFIATTENVLPSALTIAELVCKEHEWLWPLLILITFGLIICLAVLFYWRHKHKNQNTELVKLKQTAANEQQKISELEKRDSEMRQEIDCASQRVERANRAKTFFLASMSHEIRTPLNSVIGFSELLQDDDVSDEERKEFSQNILKSGNALMQLINDVLDLAKLESDQVEIVTEKVDFNNLVNEVVALFKSQAEEKKIELKNEVPQLPLLKLDILRIRQILFRLLSNGIKFTEVGNVTIRAAFQAETDFKGTFQFSVQDTGCGIAPEDMEKIMDPFQKLSCYRGTAGKVSGSGLELPICYRMVAKMNGELQAVSTEGVGTLFTVLLRDVEYVSEVNNSPD